MEFNFVDRILIYATLAWLVTWLGVSTVDIRKGQYVILDAIETLQDEHIRATDPPIDAPLDLLFPTP